MHVMEDDCSKPSAVLEALPKTNGSPSPCQIAVSTSDGEKKVPQENGTGEAEHVEASKTDEEDDDEEDEIKKEVAVQESKPVVNEEKEDNVVTEIENLSVKKTVNHKDELCSLPPSPEEDDVSAGSSPRSQSKCRKRVTSDSDSDTPAIVKKLKRSGREYEERERTVSEYIESASRTGLEEFQKHLDKLHQEIQTLNALARAKEHEWNNIIRLKKVKEEVYLRLQRKRQVILLTMGSIAKPTDTLDWDPLRFGECSIGVEEVPSVGKVTSSKAPDSGSGVSVLKNNQLPVMMVPLVTPGQASTSLKVPDGKPGARVHRPILPKPTTVVVPSGNNGNNGQNPVIGEGRQGPILDVRSIIADYRSRHPETVPRRGRRLKSSLSPTPNSQQLPDNLVSSTRVSGNGGILSMASLALGSGSQMRTGLVGSTSEMGDISFLLNAVGEAASTSRPSSADSSRSGAHTLAPSDSAAGNPGISFKDVLVQFAKLSQTEQRLEPMPPTTTASKPPPYPEVTLHPVLAPHSPPHQSASSSLLHGILTKNNNQRGDTGISPRPTTFSPTLARLLTAPERIPNVPSTTTTSFHGTGTHVSISDLLSTSKVKQNFREIPNSKIESSRDFFTTRSVNSVPWSKIMTRNEITITPVAAVQPLKAKEEEEEQEDSADRLVIDESGDIDGARSRGENEDDQGPEMAAEDVPECQGCHQRAAQFVCAGCGNQWYCSRDCQVTAWDEHSEVCSG
ncbi:hypothetical protein C0J52_21117 [Blattella germanica]|nr:hypothetical protein C0J52_21117 [Blattella germanica]